MELHWTFMFFFGALLVGAFFRHGLGEAQKLTVHYLILFGSVTLHEIGHSLTAKRFGYAEFVISFAGPVVSNVIAAVAGLPRHVKVKS